MVLFNSALLHFRSKKGVFLYLFVLKARYFFCMIYSIKTFKGFSKSGAAGKSVFCCSPINRVPVKFNACIFLTYLKTLFLIIFEVPVRAARRN